MFHVLSFDPQKIEVSVNLDQKTIVKKKAVEKEYENIVLASNHLNKHSMAILDHNNQKITIATAKIFEWHLSTKTLSTFLCAGENIEQLLRRSFGNKREVLLSLLREIFILFKTNGFLWGDFAPRNMLLDQDEKILWLVDFERNLYLKDCSIDSFLFNRYVCDYSREEFSCFLNIQEQSFLFRDFLEENYIGFLPISQIASKRKRLLLATIFGEKVLYALRQIKEVEDLMVDVATPFCVNDVFFFPMDSLDRIGSKGGSHEYAKTVMAIRSLDNIQRYSELKKRAENI